MLRTLIVSLFLICSLSAFAQVDLNKEVNFTARKLSLSKAIDKLSERAKISIAYSNNLIPQETIISIRFKKERFSTILEYLLKDTGLQYKLIGNQVVLYRAERSQKEFTISGYVEDKSTGELLIGANVYDVRSKKGTSTNVYGFYSLTIKEGLVSINYSYLGCQIETKNFDHSKDVTINVELNTSMTLSEVIVTPTDSTSFRYNNFSILDLEELPIKDMNLMPSLAGETDLIRLTHIMPGVQTGADGLGNIHVRGGGADQNLFLLDGVPVYNGSHLAGLLSIYNSDAIRSCKFSKGGFGARYGGRLSSVIDVRTKEGNSKEFKGDVSLGLTAVKATFEGPIKKNKGAFFLSGRRALLDLYLKPITTRIKEDKNQVGFSNYHYFDWNAKANYAFSNKDKIYLSFYNGRDGFLDKSQEIISIDNILGRRLEDKIEQSLTWGNTIGALRWNHLFGNKLFANTNLTYSRYKFKSESTRESLDIIADGAMGEDTFKRVAYDLYSSQIQDWAIKTDFDFIPSAEHYFRFGFEAIQHNFQPGILSTEDLSTFEEFASGSNTLLDNSKVSTYEFTLYAEHEWKPNKNWQTTLGIRGTAFQTGGHTYYRAEPRLKASYTLQNDWKLFSSWTLNYQYLHLLTPSGIGLPSDLWLPSTQQIAPQRSWQSAIGIDRRLYDKLTLGSELYFKKMDHLITYKEGDNLELLTADNWENKVTTGEGLAYGAEFYLQKNVGPTTGNFSYTLSWAKRKFAEVNFGKSYPFRYDRRHNIKINLIHRFNKKFSVAGNWSYGSGIATTLPIGQYEFPVDPFFPVAARAFSEKNSIRMPAYHRLDLGMTYKISRKWGEQQLNAGIYNVYNRKNPIYYRVRRNPDDFDKKQYLQATLFHLIPYFSYKVFL